MHLIYEPNVTIQNESNSKRKTNFNKYIISLIIVALLLPGTISVVSSMSSESGAVYSEEEPLVYVVSAGDTLWGIASEHLPYKIDIRDYIEQIRKLNNLDHSMLMVGQRLELP